MQTEGNYESCYYQNKYKLPFANSNGKKQPWYKRAQFLLVSVKTTVT